MAQALAEQTYNVKDRVIERLHNIEDTIVNKWLKEQWTPDQIGDLRGKVALVTGANSGLGFETTRKLAENGCKVFMVSRDGRNGIEAMERIKAEVPNADLEVLECDMHTMRNVVALINTFRQRSRRLDILINNAGVFHPGKLNFTPDGIEQTLALNYYAHVLLTLGVLDMLRATPGSRALWMASEAERFGRLDWDNLWGQHYKDSGLTPYSTSKLYALMFMRELAVRVPEVDFFCTHPGISLTPLQHKASWRYITAWLITTAANFMPNNSPYKGAYSAMYAATEPTLRGKHWAFIGPNDFNLYFTEERRPWHRAAHNPVSCWKLFEESVRIIQGILGSAAPITVPPHPSDWYTDMQESKRAPARSPAAADQYRGASAVTAA